MPVATVNENNRSIFRKNEILLPWKFRSMNSISKPSNMERCAQESFRLRVLATNTSHHPRAGCFVNYVCHHLVVLPPEPRALQCCQV
jgi:hypothetical protein